MDFGTEKDDEVKLALDLFMFFPRGRSGMRLLLPYHFVRRRCDLRRTDADIGRAIESSIRDREDSYNKANGNTSISVLQSRRNSPVTTSYNK